jgi:hypothetical protein
MAFLRVETEIPAISLGQARELRLGHAFPAVGMEGAIRLLPVLAH